MFVISPLVTTTRVCKYDFFFLVLYEKPFRKRVRTSRTTEGYETKTNGSRKICNNQILFV